MILHNHNFYIHNRWYLGKFFFYITSKKYWNDHADLWFGTTALPELGVRFPTEEELHIFGDVSGKKMLEICCGSGHSLLYNARKGAGDGTAFCAALFPQRFPCLRQ